MSHDPQQEIFPPGRSVNRTGQRKSQGGSNDGQTNILAVGHLHLHGNDIAELNKLAALNPALAHKVLDQRESEDRRANTSFRFGMVTALVLVAMILAAFSFLFVKVGVWSTLLAIAFVLATSLLVRVIITGQWSDTTWFGKLVEGITRALGASPPVDKDGEAT